MNTVYIPLTITSEANTVRETGIAIRTCKSIDLQACVVKMQALGLVLRLKLEDKVSVFTLGDTTLVTSHNKLRDSVISILTSWMGAQE